jgi:DNA-3-methyladenine glycosylase II
MTIASSAAHGAGTVSPTSAVAPRRLDAHSLAVGANELVARDADLAGIVRRHGPPPLWDRAPGFETLAAIVLEQQVSLRSGAAALARLRLAAGALDAVRIRALGEEGARNAGLTRQKARYVVGLAEAVVDERLDLGWMERADDEAARDALTAQVGIGPWTADIYLLMALGRADVWPTGDLALARAMQRAKRLAGLPDAAEQLAIADGWRPLRAVAARILWQAYLAGER